MQGHAVVVGISLFLVPLLDSGSLSLPFLWLKFPISCTSPAPQWAWEPTCQWKSIPEVRISCHLIIELTSQPPLPSPVYQKQIISSHWRGRNYSAQRHKSLKIRINVVSKHASTHLIYKRWSVWILPEQIDSETENMSLDINFSPPLLLLLLSCRVKFMFHSSP